MKRSASKRRRFTGLGKLQAEVMEVVWQRGEATVAQVVEQISQGRPVSYTTVLVAMQKLDGKGWLKHRRAGRAYVYSPVRSREEVHVGLLRDFLHSAFDGDPRRLLAGLMDANPMSDAELSELRTLIERRRQEKPNE
ncbi:MAG: BlaI/MecI/CopY family transcriptional regulator [Planctomycetota bacterium]